MTTISLIIPAYNEARRLPATLATVAAWRSWPAGVRLLEVIVVSDGSTDDTIGAARAFDSRLPIKIVEEMINRGKGAAVRTGVQLAAGDLVLISDADGAVPINELVKLLAVINHTPVVIGSRRLDRRLATISPLRRLVGLVFHWWCYPLIPGITDASCGFKLFRRTAARRIFAHQRLDRFAFDIEVLWLSRKLNYPVREVPVFWREIPGSKVRLVRDGWEMFWAVLGLYFRHWLG